MTRPPVSLDTPPRHADSTFPSDWIAVRANGTIVVVHEPGDMGTTAYTIGDTTRNPRVLASADAILWCGEVLKTGYEAKTVSLHHPHAGRREWLPVDDFLDDPVVVLERTQLIELRGVSGDVE